MALLLETNTDPCVGEGSQTGSNRKEMEYNEEPQRARDKQLAASWATHACTSACDHRGGEGRGMRGQKVALGWEEKGKAREGKGERIRKERGERHSAARCASVPPHLSRLWHSGQCCTFLISLSSPLCLHTLHMASSDAVTWINDRPVTMHAGNTLSHRGHDVHQSETPSLHLGHDT